MISCTAKAAVMFSNSWRKRCSLSARASSARFRLLISRAMLSS
jgi:hypothetical protein